MRLAIIGSREISDPQILLEALKEIPCLGTITEIVSGGAKGVDSLARAYAQENNLKLTEFLPDYGRYGRGAPIQRNTQIIEYADMVLAIPVKGGSAGTHDGIKKAKALGKRLYIHEISKQYAPTPTDKISLKTPKAENPYTVGDKLIHTSFGEGTVLGVDGPILNVRFTTFGDKRISCTFKGLQKID